jgi:hypothetical protein
MSPELRAIGRRLLSSGLPQGVVRRYLTELRCHHADLLDEGAAAGLSSAAAREFANRRLGTPRQLSQAALRTFRRRTLIGRHAWFFFGVWPVFCLLLLWIALGICLGCIGYCVLHTSETMTAWAIKLTPAVCGVLNFAVPLGLAVTFYRAARRRALAAVWWLFPCGFILLLGATIHLVVEFNAGSQHGRLMVGGGIPWRPALWPLSAALASFAFVRRRTLRSLIAGG